MSEPIGNLARDFGKASSQLARSLFDVFDKTGEEFAEDARNNARATAGKAAAQYPDKITHEMKFGGMGILMEVGPRAEGQGMLGRYLELGTAKSGAHLDVTRAAPAAEANLAKLAGDEMDRLMP